MDAYHVLAIACWLTVLAFAIAAAHHSYRIWRDER